MCIGFFTLPLPACWLQVESSDRPTARAALRHKWLRNGVAQDAPLGDNLATDVVETFEQRQEQTLQYLQRYGGYSHLKQAALQVKRGAGMLVVGNRGPLSGRFRSLVRAFAYACDCASSVCVCRP